MESGPIYYFLDNGFVSQIITWIFFSTGLVAVLVAIYGKYNIVTV